MAPVKLPAGSRRRAPALGGGFLKATREWWATIWASPMAAVYLDADVPALVRLARLVDLQHRGEMTAAVLSEIRQLEDRFGLSPLSRRRLQWEVSQAAGRPAEEAPAEPVDTGDERFLRAVK